MIIYLFLYLLFKLNKLDIIRPGGAMDNDAHCSVNKEDKYTFIKEIGEGTFSTVYLCQHRTTNTKFAIKKCSKTTILSKKATKHILMEKTILTKINNKHPLMITLVESFQNANSLFFVFEYCENGDLLNLIERRKPLPLDSVLFYISQIISSLEFIHSFDIVHRDIKPSNILLDAQMNIKLGDFGTATILTKPFDPTVGVPPPEKPRLERRSSFVGTAEYVSPEVLQGRDIDHRCDIWALGCLVFNMVVGYPPFRGYSDVGVFSKVMKCSFLFPDDFDVLEEDVHDLISELIQLDPNRRLGSGLAGDLSEIREHRFLRSVDWSIAPDMRISPEASVSGQKIEQKSEFLVERAFMTRCPVEMDVQSPLGVSPARLELRSPDRKKAAVILVKKVCIKSECILVLRLESDYEFEIVCPSANIAENNSLLIQGKI